MAIIRLDCNLNGGDSVTPNNELFYRIYGDLDGYASPIHTTGTAIADANVTVNLDNVIITGVDGTTNTSFKIAAVDEAGNEGILSDAFAAMDILFEDDFSGTADPFVTNDKWTVLNQGTNPPTMVEGGGILTWTNHPGAVDPSTDAQMNSKVTFDMTQTVVLGFDFSTTDMDKGWIIGFNVDGGLENRAILLSGGASTEQCSFLVGNNSQLVGNDTFTDLQEGVSTTYKIVNTPTNISLHRWDGSSWELLISYANSFGAVSLGVNMLMGTGSFSVTNTLDNVVVTSNDYLTQRPV